MKTQEQWMGIMEENEKLRNEVAIQRTEIDSLHATMLSIGNRLDALDRKVNPKGKTEGYLTRDNEFIPKTNKSEVEPAGIRSDCGDVRCARGHECANAVLEILGVPIPGGTYFEAKKVLIQKYVHHLIALKKQANYIVHYFDELNGSECSSGECGQCIKCRLSESLKRLEKLKNP